MSELTVRKIPFSFEGVDFIWNPANPAFSVAMNLVSFYIPAFERYLVKAMLEAEPLIKQDKVRETARLFRLQEGQHAKVHLAHVEALTATYPGLRQLADELVAMVDELYEQRDLRYHLAFGAALEATFTPLFKVFIDYRRCLFGQGDSRVASMLLWHFCEEIEHRSAAMEVYDEVVGKHWYRVSILPSVLQFHIRVVKLVQQSFRQHVPDLPENCFTTSPYRGVPWHAQFISITRLLLSQFPWYDHDKQPLPSWSAKWFACYDKGQDMTHFYGTPREHVK